MAIEGVIRPPPEIRAVADRTAKYVAKNGRAFEKRILASEKGSTPKFQFLHTTSPFYAYYQSRIEFYENGGEDEKEEKRDETKEKGPGPQKVKEAPKKTQQATSVIDPVAKAVLEQRSKIAQIRAAMAEADKESSEQDQKPASISVPAPPPLQFVSIVAPSTLSMAEVETIQLVAQFAAIDGKGGEFLRQLSQREWSNPAYAFLQPRSGHFAYFSALVDAYCMILTSWTTKTAKENDPIKLMANNIDKVLESAAYRAEYKRYLEEQASADNGPAPIDWHDFIVVETIDFPANEMVEVALPPPPGPSAAREENDMVESDEDEPIRVVPSYTPKVVASGAAKMETVIDPITGKTIRVDDLPEHMRIQLLDPKWAEERRRFAEKQKDSNLVSGEMVAQNLARLAEARDAFGKKEQDVLKESDSKKRLEEANRIIRESQVGPALRPAPSAPADEPVAKRLKLEDQPAPVVTHFSAPPSASATEPPPAAAESGTDDPFASFGTSTIPPKESAAALVPEAEFAASLSRPEVTLQIRIPNDRSNMAWNFYGQIVSYSTPVMSTVKSVKQEISSSHLNGMPVNKMQLRSTNGAFLKDSLTLAALNIGPSATLELVPRARGGRK